MAGGRGVGALIQRGGRAVAGMLTIATAGVWVANYYSARNPLRLSSLVILGVVARMFRCATRSCNAQVPVMDAAREREGSPHGAR